jgi:hypothetical protein
MKCVLKTTSRVPIVPQMVFDGHMSAPLHPAFPAFSSVDRDAREQRDEMIGFDRLPLRERVLDRLADLMLDADDILAFLECEASGELRATIAPEIQQMFEHINELMGRLSD